MDKKFLDHLISTLEKPRTPAETLEIDTRLSRYIEKYERLRNIVGFHDEHAWRRYAIQRIIKRKLFLSLTEKPNAKSLMEELVLAQYITESAVTAEAIDRVDRVLEKYMAAYRGLPRDENGTKQDIQDWFFGIMAVEVEDVLGLIDHEQTLLEAMILELQNILIFPPYYIKEEQLEVFVRIALSHAFLKADREFIAYFLIKKWYPLWFDKDKDTSLISSEIWKIKAHILKYEEHTFYRDLLRFIKPHATVFMVFDEVIKRYHGNLADSKLKTQAVLRDMYNELQKKVRRQVWHSFIYLVITKFTLILILEVPYELWQEGRIAYNHIGINLGIPLFLLLALTITVKVETEDNTKVLVQEVLRLLEGGSSNLPTRVPLPHARSLGRTIVFNTLFFIVYCLSYGAMIYTMIRFDFNIVSIGIFLLFITLITYLAMRIRFTAERFRILPRRRAVGREILYFFALPLLSSGQWMVRRVSRYNIILMLFDLLFESPYKTLVFLFRDFSDFAREKREMIE